MSLIFVVDIDGTLADQSHREGYLRGPVKDWDSYFRPDLVQKDPVLPGAKVGMAKLYSRLSKEEIAALYILTGRSESSRDVTTYWLTFHFNVPISQDNLLMRNEQDFRHAVIFKRDKVRLLKGRHPDAHFVFVDDDAELHNMYWEFGLPLRAPSCWDVIP